MVGFLGLDSVILVDPFPCRYSMVSVRMTYVQLWWVGSARQECVFLVPLQSPFLP